MEIVPYERQDSKYMSGVQYNYFIINNWVLRQWSTEHQYSIAKQWESVTDHQVTADHTYDTHHI